MTYDELAIDVGYRANLVVEGEVIVELKSVEREDEIIPFSLWFFSASATSQRPLRWISSPNSPN